MTRFELIGQLLGFLRPFAGRILLSVLLSMLTIASSIALMMTSAWLISIAGLQLGIASLSVAPTAVRFFGISRAVLRYLERLVSHDVTFRLLARLRVWFYAQLEPRAPAGLTVYRSGDLLARIVSDVEELQNFFIRVVAPPLTAMGVMVAMTLVFGVFDPWLGLVLLAFMLAAGALVPYLAWWQSRHPGQAIVQTRATLNTLLVDHVQGLADSAAYGHTDTQLAQFTQLNAQLATEEMRLARTDGLQMALSVLFANLAAVAVLAVAIPRVEGVYLAALALGATAAFEAFNPLSLAAASLSAELTAAERLFTISRTPLPVTTTGTQTHIPTDTTLAIHKLTFRYASHLPPVMEDFSLHIAPGERVALVGESGRGKSTLVNVLLRYWEYEAGHVRIGDTDLRAFDEETVRRIFGVMSQRTHLFNTTIRENIRIAAKSADDTAVIAAARQAQIHDFIETLPDGYDTYVGEDGAALSGGERQRIALTRVILKDAPIWILDEATANLDAETERAVMQAVDNAAARRTLLIIAHRRPQLPRLRVVTLD